LPPAGPVETSSVCGDRKWLNEYTSTWASVSAATSDSSVSKKASRSSGPTPAGPKDPAGAPRATPANWASKAPLPPAGPVDTSRGPAWYTSREVSVSPLTSRSSVSKNTCPPSGVAPTKAASNGPPPLHAASEDSTAEPSWWREYTSNCWSSSQSPVPSGSSVLNQTMSPSSVLPS
jgi:hypothetical protein